MILTRSGSAALLALSCIAAGAAVQAASPGASMTVAEKAAALDTVREYARSYTASLPNYTCTVSTRQMFTRAVGLVGGPLGSPFRIDVIEEQLTFINRREVRTITKINEARPSAAQLAQIGTVSRGEFGNLLDTIFDPTSGADIRWNRAAKLAGRRVYVFAYRVPQSSGYALLGSKGRIKVAFEGFVYADYQTGAVVRIEMKCSGIPAESEYRALNLTLEYQVATVGGREYILPSRFSMRYETSWNGAIIGAEYKSYRRFSADSTVKFDSDSGVTDVAAAEPRPQAAPAPDLVPVPAAAIAEVSEPAPPVIAVPAPVNIIRQEQPPQDKPKADAVAAPAPPPDPVFHAATRLVQLSVIAQDKDGKPVTDLRRDEFQIFDNAAPREIRFFLVDRSDSDSSAPPAPGTFTNRIGSGGSSVLLFDKLFIDGENRVFKHTVRAREKALQALKAIPPGDRIAIYSLACRFQVVREFTTDRDSLLEKLNTFAPAPAPCSDATIPENPSPTADPRQAASLAAMKAHETEGFNEIAFKRQTELGDYEFNVMADHLAGIPGRKNLIWVTSEFRLSPANLKRLSDANVAVYPVDAIGSIIGTPSAKKDRYAPLLFFAAMTGGVAFYDRDDLDAGIRAALRDGRASYTLGFYPPTEDSKAPLHQLCVRVSRAGVTLRYRTSYELKPKPPASASPVDDLVQALNRPVDATEVPVSARATRNGDRVDLSVFLDVSSLDLELSGGLWRGKVELVARFVTADGLPAGAACAQTLAFNLRPETYESMLRGDPYRSHSDLSIPAKATELKVLVGNLASEKIGTLTIPLSEMGH
jgi:VWFA-related protein